ncbi:putative signal peptide-containing protein [Cryptosporidium canis]|uniref:ABC transporter protein n=1 Tax=Cryptosporidium canis TaxID=195482 RepID=A0ABQ8P8P7_9CRYT|nr:putative signal peptide-containing protein [Cryptosporidium canis]KAJ1612613.1 putative ABC transporter protein [Cryptosporidium canis]
MKFQSLLSTLIAFLLVIYVALATEPAENLPASTESLDLPVLSTNSTETSTSQHSDEESDSESSAEEVIPVTASEIDSGLVEIEPHVQTAEDVQTVGETESGSDANAEAETEADAVAPTEEQTTQDETAEEAKTVEEDMPLEKISYTEDNASTAAESSDEEIEQASDDQTDEVADKSEEKEQEEIKESLVVYDYEAPLKLACETKKLICHNVSSSTAITIQGSRKGSALFASFDASEIRNSGLTSSDIVSATLTLNKIGGSRTLPIRIDVLNLESKSSRISKSTVLTTYQAVLPKTQNSPVTVDVTSAIQELLENAKDTENFTMLISAYSRTRFGDILVLPTKDYPSGLSLKLKVTKLPEDSSEQSVSEQPKETPSLRERIFSGNNLYVAVGILVTVVIIVTVLMIM